MNFGIARLALFFAFSTAFIGCGESEPQTAAERTESKKDEWRRQRLQAEERFAEVAQRLSPSQRERLREELRREFDDGERSLNESSLR